MPDKPPRPWRPGETRPAWNARAMAEGRQPPAALCPWCGGWNVEERGDGGREAYACRSCHEGWEVTPAGGRLPAEGPELRLDDSMDSNWHRLEARAAEAAARWLARRVLEHMARRR